MISGSHPHCVWIFKAEMQRQEDEEREWETGASQEEELQAQGRSGAGSSLLAPVARSIGFPVQ